MGDFISDVKPQFGTVLGKAGYRLIHEEESESFDNGVLIYVSDRVRIQITRDRSQILLTFRARGDHRDFDDQIMALLLEGAQQYRKQEEPDLSVASRVAFLRQHLGRIEELFGPDEVRRTCSAGISLKEERADVLFGKRGEDRG